MILKLKQLHPEGSDCTAPYSVEMSDNCTVQEFVECVLKQFPNEWGCIGIEHGKSIFGKPYIEYKYGKITTENRLKDVENANVMKATSSGGWSRMDYLLAIDDEGGEDE